MAKEQVTDEPVKQSDLLAAIKLLLDQAGGASHDQKERTAIEVERLLLEQERLKREMPENKQSPGISVFSYPEGDLAKPKPPLRCKTIWAGQEITGDVETPLELDLLNRLQPGEYRVTKANGVKIQFIVTPKHDQNGLLEEMNIWFPCKGEHKSDHLSMVSYCQQVLGDAIPSASELMAQLAKLKAELAQAKVGV